MPRGLGLNIAYDALLAAGVADPNQIFFQSVAADLVELGLDAPADDFQLMLRYVHVPNTDKGDAWRERLLHHGHIAIIRGESYRLKDKRRAGTTSGKTAVPTD